MKQRQRKGGKIVFEKLFEPTLKRKIERFLESDTPAATLTKGLLLTAALGGVIAVGIMAPNLFKVFNTKHAYEKRSKRISKEGFPRLQRGYYRLRDNRWIKFVSVDPYGNKIFRITDAGKATIYKILKIPKDSPYAITKPEIWDHKWRLILFDIPISHNNARDAFRYGLRSFGCYQIQQSVFAHPFPCVEEVKKIAQELGLQEYIKVYTVEDFDHKEAITAFHDVLKNFC